MWFGFFWFLWFLGSNGMRLERRFLVYFPFFFYWFLSHSFSIYLFCSFFFSFCHYFSGGYGLYDVVSMLPMHIVAFPSILFFIIFISDCWINFFFLFGLFKSYFWSFPKKKVLLLANAKSVNYWPVSDLFIGGSYNWSCSISRGLWN